MIVNALFAINKLHAQLFQFAALQTKQTRKKGAKINRLKTRV